MNLFLDAGGISEIISDIWYFGSSEGSLRRLRSPDDSSKKSIRFDMNGRYD